MKKLNGMGTTLVTALLTNNRLIIGHVGDSRAYLISNDQISQLTEDHSWVAEQIRLGLMHACPVLRYFTSTSPFAA